jgi:hypothetical protein
MQTPITRLPYTDSVMEEILKSLEETARSFTKLTAQEWGERKEDMTEMTYRTVFFTPAQQLVQSAIDRIRKHVALTGIVYNVQQLELSVKSKIEVIGKTIVEKRELLDGLIRKRKALAIIPTDLQKLQRFHWLTWCLGAADGCLASTAFLAAGYGLFSSVVTGLAIALAIGYSHRFYTGWIMTAATKPAQYRRGCTVLTVAAVFFSLIGFLRSAAIQNVPDIALQDEYATSTHVPPFIGWIIAAVSWVLFAVVFLMALKVWRSKEQEAADDKYSKLTNQINACESEINALKQEQENLATTLAIQKIEAVERAAYLKASIKQCCNVARESAANFKRLYARFHGSIPDHFSDPVNMQFDEGLHIVNEQNENLA